jgi:2-polyprenyl-3-methyl-5-hydroxy-6-metoxy-1,4-benzoquinol methylase
MLEVGCASGSYLYKMAKMGWQVQGIELNEKAAQAARKLGYCVYVGPLETAPRPEIAFDLIVGWMVLEHLHDPVAGLMKLNSWAKPDAWLVLSIPNAGSLEFRLFEDKWYALQVPTHMHHFTSQSIAKVLRAGGWQLETVIHQRTLSNFIGSLGYVLRDKGYTFIGEKLIEFPQRGGRLAYLLYPLCWLLSLFGQTGRMTVWAKKL